MALQIQCCKANAIATSSGYRPDSNLKIPLLSPFQTKFVHLDSQLQDVVNALTLRLRLVNVVAPYISVIVSTLPSLTQPTATLTSRVF